MMIMLISTMIPLKKSKTLIICTLTIAFYTSLMKLLQPFMYLFFTSEDSLSLILISLSTITTLMIMSTLPSPQTTTLLTLINLALIMAFSMSSLIPFYIMFELSIIPTFILVMKSGNQQERTKASMFLLMYTIFASIPLLLAIMMMYPNTNMILNISNMTQMSTPLLFIMAFLVKLPMFMFHLWLPKAHVEAPMEGSMILAAILLKLGSYGLLRLLPLMKSFMKTASPWLMSISLLGCVLTCMTCNRQKDLKSMIAYSSIAHMALILISLFSLSVSSPNSTILMTVSHAFSSSAMFFLATKTYSSFHSRNIQLFKGMSNSTPNMTFWWFMVMAANIGTPPFINLMSEIMAITCAVYWSIFTMVPLFIMSMLMTSFSINLFSQINHNSPSSLFKTLNNPPTLSLTMLIHLLPLTMLLVNPNPLL